MRFLSWAALPPHPLLLHTFVYPCWGLTTLVPWGPVLSSWQSCNMLDHSWHPQNWRSKTGTGKKWKYEYITNQCTRLPHPLGEGWFQKEEESKLRVQEAENQEWQHFEQRLHWMSKWKPQRCWRNSSCKIKMNSWSIDWWNLLPDSWFTTFNIFFCINQCQTENNAHYVSQHFVPMDLTSSKHLRNNLLLGKFILLLSVVHSVLREYSGLKLNHIVTLDHVLSVAAVCGDIKIK